VFVIVARDKERHSGLSLDTAPLGATSTFREFSKRRMSEATVELELPRELARFENSQNVEMRTVRFSQI
jgi:hypothetical protein